MGIVTKFVVEYIPPFPMSPSTKKINLKDKYEDGEIDLSMSDLQEVPIKEIAAIKKVHSLDLSNNHISVLTRNFSTLDYLIKIDLSKNELKELPDNFGELHKLKHLDLYKNQLQHLPLSFSKLKALRWLDLKDNPLVPAIANIAGPCLEPKQCQDCAKNIVTFYTKLETSVEQEKTLREEQRLKTMQANMEKAKEKKTKKAKKDKPTPTKETSQTITQSKVSEKSGNVTVKKNVNRNKKKTKLSSLSFVKLLIVALFALTVTMFILTAAKIEFVRIFEDKAVEVWSNTVNRLPDHLQGIGLELGKSIRILHDFTAKGVVTVTGYMSGFSNNHSVNVILTEVSQVFKNVSVTAGKIYVKVFGK